MSYRRTLIFFVAFALLAASYYFYEVRGGKARREAEQAEKLLFSSSVENVTKLTLERPGETIVVQKEDGDWRISKPVVTLADRSVVDGMVNTLVDLKYERNLGAQTDLQQFGLSEPEVTVGFTGHEEDVGKLLLGTSTPEGTNVYTRRSDESQVFTVKKNAKSTIDKTLFDIRDKKVFSFSLPNVKSLTLLRDGQTLVFEHGSEGEWAMLLPEEHDADNNRITKLLDSIRFAKVRKFVEEEAIDLEQCGLADPSARVELKLGDVTSVLSFGEVTEPNSDRIFARRDDEWELLQLDLDILEELSTDVDDWRDKRLVKFERAKVARLQIDSPAGAVRAERAGEDFEEWEMIEPNEAIADEDEINHLFANLQNAQVARFLRGNELEVAARIIDKPLTTVKLWEQDNEVLVILVLSKPEDESEVYAKTGRSEEIFAVNEGLLEKLAIGPEKLKDKSVLRFKEADVEGIQIAKGDESYTIRRKGVRWKLPKDVKMEQYEIDQLLWELRGLRYETIIQTEHDEAYYGLDFPHLNFELSITGLENPLRLEIGKKIPERSSYYVRGDTDTLVMEVDGAQVYEWLDKF